MLERLGYVICFPSVTGPASLRIIKPKSAGTRQSYLKYVRRDQSEEVRSVV